MKITPITVDNLKFFQSFITKEDEKFIQEDRAILPIGLVADDLGNNKDTAAVS